jgi:ABC-type Fe3+-hydroxamate transport system substrate-binding protein
MMNLQGQQAKEQQQGGPQTIVAQEQHRPRQSLNNLQDEARDASREALEAQQEAQEAIKRAYQKQIAAQEKAQQASQQVITTYQKT